jgi:hypothetical protein
MAGFAFCVAGQVLRSLDMKYAIAVSLVFCLTACITAPKSGVGPQPALEHSPPIAVRSVQLIADDYLRLTLEAGTYEAEYVDAYYGPETAQTNAKTNPRTRANLIEDARALVAIVDRILPTLTSLEDIRRANALRGMLVAADTRLQMIGGKKFSFDDEARGLFATVPVLKPLSHFDPILARLEKLVPGKGMLAARVDAFNDRYIVPTDKLKPVLETAIAECRKRTLQHMQLPAGESFTLELVTNKPWSGYNYYKGNYKSLIQVNTDLPTRISRAVDLGCHEGYPGHHVLNLMIESKLVNQNRWTEYQINPLYSPQSVISEGSANYGIDLAFPGAEKLKFERDILYPLAGLDPKTAQAFYDLSAATEELGGARLTIAKMYLNGEITRAQAVALTQKYQLVSAARAEQSVGFTAHYRRYVINYGWGRDLVRDFVERGNADGTTRWHKMEQILSEPTLPSDLQK